MRTSPCEWKSYNTIQRLFFSQNNFYSKSLWYKLGELGELHWLTVRYPTTAPMERYTTRLIWTAAIAIWQMDLHRTIKSALHCPSSPVTTRQCPSQGTEGESVSEHGNTARRGFGSRLLVHVAMLMNWNAWLNGFFNCTHTWKCFTI